MGLTLSNADAALKEDYQPAVREQLNNSVMLLQQIERNSKDVQGRRAILSLHTGRNSGIGARADGGTLPTAGKQAYSEERVSLRYNYGRIKVTGPTIRAMKSDEGSFIRAIDSETRGAVTDLRRDVNRQLFGTSDGVIVATGVTTASNTVVLSTTASAVQVSQLEVGEVVDIGVGSPFTSVATGRTITAIDDTLGASTITIDGAVVTTTTSGRVVRSGSGGSSTAQVELTGLQTIVAASGTLFNVDPTVATMWKSLVNSNSGTNRAATEILFAKAVQQGSKVGGVDIDLYITTDGVHRNYAAQLQSQKRFSNTIELKGGYTALSVTAGNNGQVGLIWDRDCPANQAFGLSTSHLTQNEMSDWEWMDEDGAVLSRVSGEDAYEAVLFKYHELTTDQRNAHVLIKDLTES